MTSEQAFEGGQAGSAPPQSSGLSTTDIRMLAVRRTGEALTRLLDDLNRWIEAHAEVTGADHLGHVTARLELARQHEMRMAAQRAATDPEQERQARRWAQDALDRARSFQEQFPRRASAFDFAYALSAAVRKAEECRRSGMPAPPAADLVATVASPVIIGPEQGAAPGAVAILTLPPVTEEHSAHDETPEDPDTDAEPRQVEPRPLPPADRQIAAEQIVALITGTVNQIDRVLALADVLHGHPAPDGYPARQPLDTAGPAPEVALAVAVEIQRLRAAEYTRRHQDAMRILNRASRASEGERT